MIAAVALGSLAAVLWGCTSVVSAPAARITTPFVAWFWTSIAGFTIALPVALATGLPTFRGDDLALVVIAGVAYAAGSGFWLLALSAGRVSIVVPIVATDGAIAAVLATLNGASIGATVAIALAAMVIGIVLVTVGARQEGEPGVLAFSTKAARPLPVTVAISLLGAGAFGLVFFTSGETSGLAPIWVVALARLVQAVCALPIWLVRRRPTPLPEAWRYIVAYGVLDVSAYALYVTGAGHNVAVAAVAASQYAALAVIGAIIVFRERIAGIQMIGIAMLLASIVFVAAQG